MGEKIVTQNRRAHHEYHILERHEAGIVLRGTEVKSLRNGHIMLKDSYADVQNGELFLVDEIRWARRERGQISKRLFQE